MRKRETYETVNKEFRLQTFHLLTHFFFPLLKKLIPKVEFLDLSYNQLSTVENLQVC